jgi:hypothetical protein
MASLIPKEPEKFGLNKENIAHYREITVATMVKKGNK